MYEELVQEAKALDKRATPGPWMWEIRTNIRDCKLMTAHSGQYYVMQFARWGMQDACPEFQVYDRYSGPVVERGSHGMLRADKMAKSYPGKEHHHGYDDYIDHPDAEYIAKSRGLFTKLIEAVEALTAENAAKDAEIERLRKENQSLAMNGGRYITIAEQRYELYSGALDTVEKREMEIIALKADLARVKAELSAYKKHGLEPCDHAMVRHALEEEKRCKEELNEAIKLIARVVAERDAWKAKAQYVDDGRERGEDYFPWRGPKEAD